MRRSRPRQIIVFAWTKTVGDMIDANAVVRAHCPRCKGGGPVDLEALAAKHGRLFTLWNREPSCRATDCDDRITFIAQIAGSGVWPLILVGADPVEIAVIEERWRADRLNNSMGGSMALQLTVGVVRSMARLGMFTEEERRRLVKDAVATIPKDRQADAAWLLDYYLGLGQPRPGWL